MSSVYLLNRDRPLRNHQGSTLIGGKGASIEHLITAGFNVPKTACISREAYTRFLNSNGLRERIGLEFHRKDFASMRWEEIWDTALRIRRLFLATPLPADLAEEIAQLLQQEFTGQLIAVRSSSPDEDQQQSSFAGLHASYLNIPLSDALQHVKKVWASLWSDKALLYRRELGLSLDSSTMAVVIQEMIESRVSGICFTRDPLGTESMIIEAVYGYNQGLVEGEVQPDRWFLAEDSGAILNHTPPAAARQQITARQGILTLHPVSKEKAIQPPLTRDNLQQLYHTCRKLESVFRVPLDIEWTYSGERLYILQSRPVSTLDREDRNDQRPWYLSLHRSFDNLVKLQHAIVDDMLPAMDREAKDLQQVNLRELSDDELGRHILHCSDRNRHWIGIYWKDCIPFAHGIRLFGEIYNDLMLPDDPYEFVLLLRDQTLLSKTRNQLIDDLAELIRHDPNLRQQLETGGTSAVTDRTFQDALGSLTSRFPTFQPSPSGTLQPPHDLLANVILEYARLPRRLNRHQTEQRDRLEQRFLNLMSSTTHPLNGKDLLELARMSYRIRDDDNIYLGRIEHEVHRAVKEATNRPVCAGQPALATITPEEAAALLKGRRADQPGPIDASPVEREQEPVNILPRQLVGQPASKGVAVGSARVIKDPGELAAFKAGEILVVRNIDPNMTFVAPLAAGIIEDRGGMLIHGAIIAREYGLPCITGINGAVEKISTGDRVTVDGDLGIVTIDRDDPKEASEA